MRYLLTHSLLSSWLWAMKDNPYEDMTTERDSYADFIKALNREEIEKTKPMQDGIDFEDLVTDVLFDLADKKHKWYDAAVMVHNIVRTGSILQYRGMKEVTIAGKDLLLYGRLDAHRAGVIYDIKFSRSYERGRFYDSTQHPMYLELVPEADRFIYVVSNGSAVWQEVYERDETPSVLPIIEDFLGWLDSHDLMGVYEEKWEALK